MKEFEFFGASRATRQQHFKTSSTGDENGDDLVEVVFSVYNRAQENQLWKGTGQN